MHLFVNVYLVSRVYGGPEEGGWWYDAGEPLASVPVPAIRAKGQSYVCGFGSVVTKACDVCEGTGARETEDGIENCPYCGLVPADPRGAAAILAAQRKAFDGDPGRDQELHVSLETHFARPWPETRPQYE